MDKLIYEYCLLRYVPDVERGEFVNVGLMMMCKRMRWLRVELHIDDKRILAIFPRADLKRLCVQLSVFKRSGVPFKDLPVEESYRWMAALKSAVIQTSPSHPGLLRGAADVAEANEKLSEKFEELFSRLVVCRGG